jgi:hypothetical protein
MSWRAPSRPPLRRCLLCGGDFVGWAEGACRRCLAEVGPDREALSGELRARREAPQTPPSSPDASRRPVPYNEFPPGF